MKYIKVGNLGEWLRGKGMVALTHILKGLHGVKEEMLALKASKPCTVS